MKKRLLGLLLLLWVIAPLTLAASPPDPIAVYIDGEKLEPSVDPQIIDSRTYVPIRVIAEKWGAVVGWNQERQQVRITKDRQRIDLYIDNVEAHVNGESVYSDAPPVVLEGRTLIPLRFVGELLGAYVSYDTSTRSVSVLLPKKQTPVSPGDGHDGTGEERELPLATLQAIHFANDTVFLQTSDPVEPTVFYLPQPDRLVVDLPRTSIDPGIVGAGVFDPDTYQSRIEVESELVDLIRYANHNPEEHLLRIVIDLNTKADYTLSHEVSSNGIIISMKPGVYKVVLDAGHGGKDPGASYFGRMEKEFNLQMVLRMHQLLQEELRIEPLLTRSTDEFWELQERVDFAKLHQADAFISIHANAFPNRSTVRGSETYYTHDYQKTFAETLHRELLQATGFPDRGLHSRNFFVTRHSHIPAALVEVGYMSNPEDFSELFREEFQHRVALGLVQGLKSYFNL